MSGRRATFDTISGWIAVNIVIAIAICIGLNALFIHLAGVWARPDFPEGGLGERVATTVHLIAGMPAGERARVAEAASTTQVAVRWYADDKAMQLPVLGSPPVDGADTIRRLLQREDARLTAYTPGEIEIDGQPLADYKLAVDLPDGSWVVFTAHGRIWGLDTPTRVLIIGLFVLASTLLVAFMASRRLARPMERLARAARRFSTHIQADGMAPSGPRESRAVIEAFNTMQERIQRFVADRDEMLTAISHDLRAPLTRLRLRGEFIEDAEQQRRLFRDVDEMQHMINSALRFFRDETEAESPTRLDLTELIHTVLEDYETTGAVAFQGPDHQIGYGRPRALRRALTNILDNAVKYGQRAHVALHADDRELRVTVDDDGPGIPSDQHTAVFRPFFRLEHSRNRRTGGVGLGLGTARSIVRAHGGELTLHNRIPRGLRVVIRLPAPST